jgi:hypothetical protein
VLAWWLAGAVAWGLQCSALPARAETPGPRPVRVTLAPEERKVMSGIAWRAMTQECDAIWAREGVILTWSKTETGSDVRLPLRFDDRELRKRDPKGDAALGVTVFEGRSQRILVSIARAREVIALRRGLADSGDATTLDIALGVLLGRVIAHEIGHALLLTTRHSSEGLMRADYDADVRSATSGQFALARHERERLNVRFSNMPARGHVAAADTALKSARHAPGLKTGGYPRLANSGGSGDQRSRPE